MQPKVLSVTGILQLHISKPPYTFHEPMENQEKLFAQILKPGNFKLQTKKVSLNLRLQTHH